MSDRASAVSHMQGSVPKLRCYAAAPQLSSPARNSLAGGVLDAYPRFTNRVLRGIGRGAINTQFGG